MSSSSRHKEKRPVSAEPRDRSRSRSPQPHVQERTSTVSETNNKPAREPPPPSKHKAQSTKITGIKMKLGPTAVAPPAHGLRKPGAPKKLAISSVFGEESDSEDEEEMPAFASMRMKNIGRKTPTSSGPNSFGKTKNGFCDQKKIFEKMSKDLE